MKKIILQQAFEELNDAIAYYEEQQAGLGLRLKDEVDQHVNWILGNSTVPQIRRGSYRRVNLKIFPYISLTLFVKIPYGFLLLHMVIVNPNTGLKERTKSANQALLAPR